MLGVIYNFLKRGCIKKLASLGSRSVNGLYRSSSREDKGQPPELLFRLI